LEPDRPDASFRKGRSGAWLLLVATQGGDLGAQQRRTLQIAPGEGDGQGELELFELVIALFL
jgi:hypothetical protein